MRVCPANVLDMGLSEKRPGWESGLSDFRWLCWFWVCLAVRRVFLSLFLSMMIINDRCLVDVSMWWSIWEGFGVVLKIVIDVLRPGQQTHPYEIQHIGFVRDTPSGYV